QAWWRLLGSILCPGGSRPRADCRLLGGSKGPFGASLAAVPKRTVTCSSAPGPQGSGRRRRGVDVGRCGPATREGHMEIAYTEEQRALKSELRAYYEGLLTPEVEQELALAGGVGPAVRRVVKQMGSDGWLGIGWPTEWGGQGRSAIEQFIFFDESMRSGAPVPMLTINTVGPTLMNYGSE